jgi:hypothetical protein
MFGPCSLIAQFWYQTYFLWKNFKVQYYLDSRQQVQQEAQALRKFAVQMMAGIAILGSSFPWCRPRFTEFIVISHYRLGWGPCCSDPFVVELVVVRKSVMNINKVGCEGRYEVAVTSNLLLNLLPRVTLNRFQACGLFAFSQACWAYRVSTVFSFART